MIVPILSLIAAAACVVYACVQWCLASHHAHINIIHKDYNLWAGLGLLGAIVMLGVAGISYHGEFVRKQRVAELDQCGKAAMMWPGRTLFTDHCYVEVKEGSGVYMRHASLDPNYYTKQEVLGKEIP